MKDWNGQTFQFAYTGANMGSGDGKSNLATITYPSMGASTEKATFTYDAMNNVISDTLTGPYASSDAYGRNPDNLVNSGSVGGVATSYGYNLRNQMTTATDSTGVIHTLGFAANGQLQSDQPQGQGTTIYTYNPGGQLTQMSVPTSASTSTVTSYGYTNDGQRCASAPGTTPPSCTSPPSSATTATFNAYGQMSTYATPASGTSPGSQATYTYDGNGLRSSVTTGSTTTDFVWDQSTIGGVPLLLEDGTNAYLYGPLTFGGTAPLEQISLADGSSTTQLVSNAKGVVAAITPTTTTKPTTMTYSIWGQRSTSGTSFPTPFGFQGSYTDQSGLVFDVNRYYDPTTAQFLTVDPAVSSTGQPYAFAGGDPANATDPMGLCSDYSAPGLYTYIQGLCQDNGGCLKVGSYGCFNPGPNCPYYFPDCYSYTPSSGSSNPVWAPSQTLINQPSEVVTYRPPPPPAKPKHPGCFSSIWSAFSCVGHAVVHHIGTIASVASIGRCIAASAGACVIGAIAAFVLRVAQRSEDGVSVMSSQNFIDGLATVASMGLVGVGGLAADGGSIAGTDMEEAPSAVQAIMKVNGALPDVAGLGLSGASGDW